MARGGNIYFSKGGGGYRLWTEILTVNLQALRHGEFYASRRYLGTRVDNDNHFVSFFGKKKAPKDNHFLRKNYVIIVIIVVSRKIKF